MLGPTPAFGPKWLLIKKSKVCCCSRAKRRHEETGCRFHKSKQVIWKNGSAERTTLAENSIDWLTMASSFHWADFKIATEEFHRVLRPNGLFTALWDPRFIEDNPLLVEIENKLTELNPDIKGIVWALWNYRSADRQAVIFRVLS